MDAAAFYNSVLPSSGLRVLAVFKAGLQNPPTHYYYDTNEELVEAATVFDAQGKNVYHGCSTYATDQNRKADNVAAVGSLWIDLDVGETKPHKTLQDAIDSVKNFKQALTLPSPFYVTSGSGLHAYWPFTKAIPADKWDTLSAVFAACLNHAGVKHDSSRTQDKASILRVPGTLNYKTDPPKPISILRPGTPTPVSEIFKALKAYAETNNVLVAPRSQPKTEINADLIGTKDYPPSIGSIVAQHCPVLQEVESSGGDVAYEVWWRAMGVAKHTSEPLEVAVHWTRTRADTGHSKADAETIVEQWTAGPTTCAEFSKHSDKCASCAHFGKIKSPIQLGHPEEPLVSVKPPSPPPVRSWAFMEPWIMAAAQAKGIGYSNNQLTFVYKDEHGAAQTLPFCDRYWQVMDRVRASDGTWQLEIEYVLYDGEPSKRFLLDSSAVTSTDVLKKEFSARELHIYGGQKGMTTAQTLLQYHQKLLAEQQQETQTYPTMGWVTEDNQPRGPLTGEFVLGSYKFAPRLPPTQVLMGENVPRKLAVDFGESGTLGGWVDLVDKIYNRDGAEPYQFLICAMFAAPLVRLTAGTNWHGIPIALSGKTGAAKTTTAMMAAAIYGNPDLLSFNLAKSQGDTLNAFGLKVGVMNNLPFLADEMSDREPEFIEDVMYMLANGQSRDRMGPNGQMLENPYRWDTISIITSNDKIHDRLKELRNQSVQDATRIRCFEIELTKEHLRKTFPDVQPAEFEQEFVRKQYGVVGRSWIQAIVNNRTKVEQIIAKKRLSYKIDELDESDMRFYKDLLLIVEVAAMLAQQRGLIHWNIAKMMDWAKLQLRSLRDGVRFKDWDSTCSDFFGSLHGRTIVSRKLRLGRGRRTTPEMPLEPLSASITPVARRALEDRLFVVTTNYVYEWCKEHRIPATDLVGSFRRLGYLVERDGKEQRLVSIGSGTTIARPQAMCFEFNYDKVEAADAIEPTEIEDTTNVVDFPTPLGDPAPAAQNAAQ